MIAAPLARAQTSEPSRLPPGAVVQPLEDPAGAELRRNLTTLAANPRSLSALIGAGRAAIAMGDGEAALSFFARAEEVGPSDARVKAGMASALVLLERGSAALSLFAEAEALGAPEVEIARDRGLAYDMIGDPRRAQQDYALVLRRGDDPEVRRRMALSLAISGQRAAALDMIGEQLRRQDRAAWRTQAFVLALTGDTAGANQTAARMMGGGSARSMEPFFARLAALSPAQKAMAVHFGHFPRDGRATASAGLDTSADPGAIALAQGGIPPAAARAREPLAAPQPAERRRPGASAGLRERVDLGRRASRDPEQAGPIAPPVLRPAPQRQMRRFEPPRPQARQEPEPPPARPEPLAEPPPTQPEPQPEPPPAQPEPQPEPAAAVETHASVETQPEAVETQPAIQLADRGGDAAAAPGFMLTPGGEQPRAAPAPASAADLSDIAALVASLPEEEARPSPPPARAPARGAPRQIRAAESRPAPQRAAAARRPAQPVHPSRRWVQIATVPDRAASQREFARLRARAPQQLGSRAAYAAPYGRSSTRLLVGPFDNARAAQEFVNQLGRSNVSAFAWTSEAGQEIERLQTRR